MPLLSFVFIEPISTLTLKSLLAYSQQGLSIIFYSRRCGYFFQKVRLSKNQPI
jgi:hypothetical protein